MALNERDVSDPRLELLYRDAAREAPPAHLDAAILAAARREVGARPRALSSVLRRWHVPVSIAAVVVVSVSLVILVKEEGGERIGETRIPLVAAPAEPSAAAPAPATAVAKQAAKPQVESPAPSEHRTLREDSTHAPALNQLKDATRGERDSASAPMREPLRAAQSRPAQTPAEAPATADTATAGRRAAASAEPSQEQAGGLGTDAVSARSMARALAVKPAEQDRPPVWQGLEKEPPEKWIVRIEELMREGRAAEAEEMRTEFKRRFPEHPLARDAK